MTCHAIEKQNFIWVKFGAAAFLYRLSICYCKYYILLKNHHDLVKNNLPLFFFHAEALDDRQRYINFSLRFFALWGSKLLFCFCLLLEIHFSQTDDSSFGCAAASKRPQNEASRPRQRLLNFFFEGRDFIGLKLQRFHFQSSTRIRSHILKFQ